MATAVNVVKHQQCVGLINHGNHLFEDRSFKMGRHRSPQADR